MTRIGKHLMVGGCVLLSFPVILALAALFGKVRNDSGINLIVFLGLFVGVDLIFIAIGAAIVRWRPKQ